jgi:hypothetical protein
MKYYQFSPVRSGSTLLYNILKEILPHNIQKIHQYIHNKNDKYFCTIRHPYNSIISLMLCYKLEINEKNLCRNISIYLQEGGKYIIDKHFIENKNILKLKYEDFNNNIPFIIQEISKFLKIDVSKEKIKELTDKYSKENVKKITNKYSNFSDYCKKTHFHGDHISKYNGETEYEKILDDKLIKILKKNNLSNHKRIL